MDVRVLILWHPGGICRASIIALEVGRRWKKMCPSKQECMDDLWRVGLLTWVEHYDGLRSDFDTRDRLVLGQAIIEVEVLEEAGFVETTPAKPN